MYRPPMCFRMILIVCVSFVTLASVSPVQADWEFQDSGTTEMLYDVCFVDELHGWAVGNGSTIIATNDGGETWERQISPVNKMNYRNVVFLTQNVGYCIGDEYININETPNPDGIIIKTMDGGGSWEKIEVQYELRQMYDLTFVDENTGRVTADPGGLLLFTDDGGETWVLQYRFDDYEWPLNKVYPSVKASPKVNLLGLDSHKTANFLCI